MSITMDAYYYALACAVMAFGIGLDVAMATLSRIRHMTVKFAWRWSLRITFTHVAFPMLGYYGFLELFTLFPVLRPLLGVVAFSLVMYFLWQVFRSWTSSDFEPEVAGGSVSWAAVLAVSWDALFSGPAKSAQAADWTGWQVWASFFITGAIVALITLGSSFFALYLRGKVGRWVAKDVFRFSYAIALMMYIEFVIIGYFGWLALARYVFGLEYSSLSVFLFSVVFSAIVFLWRRQVLFSNSLKTAEADLASLA